ncbi:hypothetical protein TNCV_2331781 [Trichonephila clavipes]|nr:hypothetical protein TNCV_2331781 [Trichonephila clavipes]
MVLKEGRFVLGTFRSERMRVLNRSRQDDRLRVVLIYIFVFKAAIADPDSQRYDVENVALGHHFADDEELKNAVTHWFKSQVATFYAGGIDSDDENEMNNAASVPTSSEMSNVLKKEFVAVDDDNAYAAPIMADKDILEFVQSSKDVIAGSEDENEINNADLVPTPSEMRNIIKKYAIT